MWRDQFTVDMLPLLLLLCTAVSVFSCPDKCTCREDLVNCAGRNLHSIPYNLPKTARVIRLDDNEIAHVSNDAFLGLDKLQILSLTRNKIDDVPPGTFENTPHLMSLDLGNNELRYLERDAFKGLSDLMTLSMAYNDLRSLSGVLHHVPNLGSLNVGYNKLTRITEHDLQSAPAVKMLDLSNNQISQVHPAAFSNISAMRYLFLQNNPLGDGLPDLNLTNTRLQLADFTNCNLTRVPQVMPPTVNDLRLSNNQIKIVQETDIRNITRLQLLTLNNNQITNVIYRAFSGMINLKELWLSHNKMVYIPRGLPSSLKKLYIDNNLLQEMELSAFKNDSQLEYLSMEMNRIAMIPDGAFNNMANLKLLDLKANRVKTLKHGTFSKLPNLEYIDLSNNPIEKIEEGTFQDLNNLTKLGMSYIVSTMTEIGENFLDTMPNVETVELMNSPGMVKGLMMHIAKKPFVALLNATDVNLMYCNLRTLPPPVKDWFPNVNNFYLDGNTWACDVRMLWLRDWLADGQQVFTKDGAPLTCHLPPKLRGSEIAQLHDWEFGEPVEEEEEETQAVPSQLAGDTSAGNPGSGLTDTTTTQPTTQTTSVTTTTTTTQTTSTEKATTPAPVRRRVFARGRRPNTPFNRRQQGGTAKRRRRPGYARRRLRGKGKRRFKGRFKGRRRKPTKPTKPGPTLKNLRIRHPNKKAKQLARWREQQSNSKTTP